MASGKLVGSDIVVELMSDYIDKSSKNIFLADGFPRSQENIDVWTEMMGDKVFNTCVKKKTTAKI